MQMMAYRKMLAEAGNSSDTGMINRMTEIAQYLHSNGLFNEVANELVEYILNVGSIKFTNKFYRFSAVTGWPICISLTAF